MTTSQLDASTTKFSITKKRPRLTDSSSVSEENDLINSGNDVEDEEIPEELESKTENAEFDDINPEIDTSSWTPEVGNQSGSLKDVEDQVRAWARRVGFEIHRAHSKKNLGWYWIFVILSITATN